MDVLEQSRFDALYAQHLRALKLQGKADATVNGHARALRRISIAVLTSAWAVRSSDKVRRHRGAACAERRRGRTVRLLRSLLARPIA